MKKRNRSLVSILKEGDYQGFRQFLRDHIGNVSEQEETEFFKKAPEHWKRAYIKRIWPQPVSERCLMISGGKEALQLLYDMWGFWQENLLWVFENGSIGACRRVLSCLREVPTDEVEEAMLKRKDIELLHMWLDKFGELCEDSERMLEEQMCLQSMKTAYIDYELSHEKNKGSD